MLDRNISDGKKYIKNIIFNLYSRNSSKDVISLTELRNVVIVY